MVDDSVDGDAISLRDAILAEEIYNSGGEITEADVEEAGRRIRQHWNRILSENLDQTLLEEIREERTVILHGTALKIIDALQDIPEPEAGSRGRRPYSNIFTMQAWMIAQWQQFRRPDLPMRSKKGESILGLLASRTGLIGGERFHRSQDAWKRILDNATRLIRANKELESATSNIKSHIDVEKL